MLEARRIGYMHDDGNTLEQWNIAAVIHRHEKACRVNWAKVMGSPTGKCGLSGVIALRNALLRVEGILQKRASWPTRGVLILVGAWDEKRRRAYRYLRRFGYCRGYDGDLFKILATRERRQ